MPQLQAHVRGALNMGVTEEQLNGIVAALRSHGMEAEALRCEAAIAAVGGQPMPAVSSSSWPLGEPNDAYAKYFTGQSYLALLDTVSGLCNVSFEPGCRNNWHVHHGAVQMLICVSGRGWYQEWGKPAVELKPGVTTAPPRTAGCSTSPTTPTPSPATATSGSSLSPTSSTILCNNNNCVL